MFLTRVARAGFHKRPTVFIRSFSGKTQLTNPEMESLKIKFDDLEKAVTELKADLETMKHEFSKHKEHNSSDYSLLRVGDSTFEINKKDSKSLGNILIYDYLVYLTRIVGICCVVYWIFR